MTYRQALRYLDSFINYEKSGYTSRNSFKLSRMRRLAAMCRDPQNSFTSVHIAGTKGKGSIVAFVCSILQESGYSVGSYTSPHLVDPRERIRINGRMISKPDFASYVRKIEIVLSKEATGFAPTFFEIYTLLAFIYFKAKRVDFAVIETGLGGRLDATNIINSAVSAISPISHDHTEILGSDLRMIAFEKSGIIKGRGVCVSAPQTDRVSGIIRRRCEALRTRYILVGRDITACEVKSDSRKEIFDIDGLLGKYRRCVSHLLGKHQIINAACAIGIVEGLIGMGVTIKGRSMKEGIGKARNPGRCEVLGRGPYIVADGAQNRESARAIKETIKRNFKYKRLILVLGVSRDKDIKGICEELIPEAWRVVLTRAKIARAEEPGRMRRFVRGKETVLTGSVCHAIERARTLAGKRDMILITGSLFVVGEAKELICGQERVTA
ncbi:MAG: folylpolyglutamate synthase/dihydrofolate synthase family protein [Candidatus Omnitrophota bacterium]